MKAFHASHIYGMATISLSAPTNDPLPSVTQPLYKGHGIPIRYVAHHHRRDVSSQPVREFLRHNKKCRFVKPASTRGYLPRDNYVFSHRIKSLHMAQRKWRGGGTRGCPPGPSPYVVRISQPLFFLLFPFCSHLSVY